MLSDLRHDAMTVLRIPAVWIFALMYGTACGLVAYLVLR